MATVYKTVNGRRIGKVIALNDGVQPELERRTFEIAARAEVLLIEHGSVLRLWPRSSPRWRPARRAARSRHSG